LQEIEEYSSQLNPSISMELTSPLPEIGEKFM
jgi:hypothetical protein